jgi:hypothetical protein
VTLPLANTAEGGSDTTTVSPGNSGGGSGDAFTAVTNGANTTTTFSATQKANGALSYAIAETTATTATAYLEWGSASVGGPHVTLYGRLYIYLPSSPVTALYCMRLLSTSTSGAGLRINTNRTLQWANATTAVGTASSTAIALTTWTRIEWTCALATTAVGTGTANLYTGNSTTIDSTASVTGQTWAIASADVCRYGWTNVGGIASGAITYFDDLQVNNTGLPGPGGGAVVTVKQLAALGVG